ncbi:hypothetical protein LG047_15385 [Methylocystis sp. WRRC1]|uniref:hypothetical protein n=1 Tax=Methylocystis sp. WRRC1 TaxID=1732014 RepID=UPI001D146B4F|nr:hypothetical protein [Methylocystis sp. WRRC1]MCC3246683.1 hypothetical protein [Methylocystis sp. WRRC1]
MALTDAQKTDVRRFAGYSLRANFPATENSDEADIIIGGGNFTTLVHVLDYLSPAEEATIVNVYLTNLTALEAAIPAASDNLDTDKAAVWEHNRDEVAHRTALFDQWRRRMCGFLGVKPGPALGGSVSGGGMNISLTRG